MPQPSHDERDDAVGKAYGVSMERSGGKALRSSVAAESGEWLTLSQAAARLRVSIDTLRRRIKRQELQSRLVVTRYGPTYQVCIGEAPMVSTREDPAEGRRDGTAHGGGSGEGMRELVRLVERLQQENRDLAIRVGYLEAQVEQAVAYVRNNPVRRGLVDEARDYPFSGSLVFGT